MKRATLLIAILILFSGCSTTLKQQWYDFNAYYNTFYNAQQYFEAGLEQDRQAQTPLNPNELIRIHPPPAGSGQADFAVAIEKSAEILRRHSRSSYVDDAVELIGKSYFYRQEYFAAQEQFRDLYRTTASADMRQRAVIWEGRTYLELGLYGEGIRFLEEQMGITDPWTFLESDEEIQPVLQQWTPARMAEARAVLAQLYAFRGNEQMAGLQLLQALGDLDKKTLSPRAYFHYGQLMERLENYEQAASAYRSVTRLRSDFDLEYQAALRLAIVMRSQGREEEALEHLEAMAREDLYREQRAELQLEIARAENGLGLQSESEERLNRILRGDRVSPEPAVRARVYLELADLYRLRDRDYITAAAYYDSAATVQVSPERLPAGWNADDLAEVWGEYAALRGEVERLDQLIALGNLSDQELEDRLQEIREEESGRERTEQQIWQMDPETESEPAEAITTTSSPHGFLNIRNRVMLERAMNQFQALWDHPPLADNWRRSQGLSGIREIVSADALAPGAFSLESDEQVEMEGVERDGPRPLDISDLPRTPEALAETIRRKYEYHYRLGNLYLLRLEMPEEAEREFFNVWQEGPPEAPRTAAAYAMTEIALMRGDRQRAQEWADQLFESAPDSRYAERLADRPGIVPPSSYMVGQPYVDPEPFTQEEEVAALLMEQVRDMILESRDEEIHKSRQVLWYRIDESLRENERLTSLMAVIYPYRGENWDRIRNLLREIADVYSQTRSGAQAARLLEELERYPHLTTFLEEPDLIPVP